MKSKIIPLLSLLTALFCHTPLPAQARGGTLPTPPASTHRLFYIQRSKDANTIMYDANLTPDGRLDPQKPVQVYWIRYADRGQREDLTAFQWQMAYGYKHKQLSSPAEAYDICLNAFKKRPIRIIHHQGKPVAIAVINGRDAFLQKVFVQVDPASGWVPRVQYVDMFGIDPDIGQPVHERIRF
ncbi:DUF4833 domain-containing protein [Spirosoma soli]|uniref:DUF4833 domain-containing protein n=1 Tax=Spirosoma soli TaxID=1770529 RepID=A0ABW5ME81_9BACT